MPSGKAADSSGAVVVAPVVRRTAGGLNGAARRTVTAWLAVRRIMAVHGGDRAPAEHLTATMAVAIRRNHVTTRDGDRPLAGDRTPDARTCVR